MWSILPSIDSTGSVFPGLNPIWTSQRLNVVFSEDKACAQPLCYGSSPSLPLERSIWLSRKQAQQFDSILLTSHYLPLFLRFIFLLFFCPCKRQEKLRDACVIVALGFKCILPSLLLQPIAEVSYIWAPQLSLSYNKLKLFCGNKKKKEQRERLK